MSDTPENNDPNSQPEVPKPHKKRRWGRWVLGIGAGFIVLLAVVIVVVPKYAARYLMETELAKLGVETTGVETLDVRLWSGEIYMGPIEFWSEGSERGQVGQVGADVSIISLVKQRALIETFIIDGLDLIAEKRDDGFYINGIPIAQFIAAEDTEAEAEPEPAPEEEGGTSWGAGIDRFDFRNSKLILRNLVPDDDLVIEIDSLLVTRFHTWDPENPGVIRLRGKIDGGPLAADITARPFADDIQFRAEASVTDLPVEDLFDYGRIALVLDRDILTRRDGFFSTTQSYSGFLFSSGRLEMQGRTTGTFRDFSVTTDAGDLVEIAEAHVTFLTSETYTEAGNIDMGGELTGRFNGVNVVTADGIALQIDSVETGSEEFFALVGDDQSFDVKAPHLTTLSGLRIQPEPDVEVAAGSLALATSGLSITGNAEGDINIGGRIQLDVEDVNTKPDPNTAVNAGKLSTSVSDLKLAQSQAGLQVDTSVETKVENVLVQQGTDLDAGVGAATVALAGLSLTMGPDGTIRLTTQPQIDVSAAEVKAPTPLSVDQLSVALTSLVTELAGENTSVELAGTTSIAATKATMPAADGMPEMSVELGSLDVALNQVKASITGSEQTWNVAVDVTGEQIGSEIKAGDSVDTVSIGQLNVSGVEADQNLAIGINEIVIGGLAADVTDQALAAFGGDGGDQGGGEGASSPSGPAPTVRLGRLAIIPDSSVKFTDTSLQPPVASTVIFNNVEIKNVDTGVPTTRTDILVDANVNEFTDLKVTGWAAALKPTPDFDLTVDLDNLSLPTYSPYVSEAIGWHLDGGELTTDVKANAASNNLNGKLHVVVDNLFLNPVSEADGKAAEEQLGIPLQFAVGIMKDDDGRIDLEFPLGGTL